jgi:hypothetical protein
MSATRKCEKTNDKNKMVFHIIFSANTEVKTASTNLFCCH